MTTRRRYVLGGLLASLGALAAAVLADVLATVFFAITVAYMAIPIRKRLTRTGLSHRTASLAATAMVFVAVLVILAPLVVVVWLRLPNLLALLETIPRTVSVDLLGFSSSVTVEQLVTAGRRSLQRAAREIVTGTAVLVLKLSLFTIVVYALVSSDQQLRAAVLAVVPPGYRDVLAALDDRARATLFAIYVLQAATALVTFLVAVPLFAALGYDALWSLAVIAGVLQFLPIVGPSVLLVGLAAHQVVLGQVEGAVLVLVVGGAVVAWLPDIVVRVWLARGATRLPGSLYFVGFVGGLLTLGTIGVIAGPLVVALVAETASILADELDAGPVA